MNATVPFSGPSWAVAARARVHGTGALEPAEQHPARQRCRQDASATAATYSLRPRCREPTRRAAAASRAEPRPPSLRPSWHRARASTVRAGLYRSPELPALATSATADPLRSESNARTRQRCAAGRKARAQQARDRLTAERCAAALVDLLCVPHTVKYTDLRMYVRSQLERLGRPIAPCAGTNGEFYGRVRARGPANQRQFERLVAIITQKGGVCLSTQYVGYRVPVDIRCAKGHEFKATLEAVAQKPERGPRFCPQCSPTQPRTVDELKATVESAGFTYHGDCFRFVGGKRRRHAVVRCPEGHLAVKNLDNVKPGADGALEKGCEACRRAKLGNHRRLTPDQMVAAHRVGYMLAGEYTNATTVCDWVCSNGHITQSTYNNLGKKKGSCMGCRLAAFEAKYNMTLRVPWTRGNLVKTPLKWAFNRCGHEAEFSYDHIRHHTPICMRCLREKRNAKGP